MTAPSDSGHEPADLSEVTATDALLDRLGSRDAEEADLLDPAAAALLELLAVIDQSREPDVAAVRLIEVLAGRPLYITGSDSTAEQAPLIIDLTEHDVADDAEGNPHDPVIPVTQRPKPSLIPMPARVAARGSGPRSIRDRALGHALLPAASVLLLLAIGGGVSAAVTGDPMTPVNGITRVMAQLPGVSSSVDRVKTEIYAARRAVNQSDERTARMHLLKAKAELNNVPDSQQPHLNDLIAEVQAGLVPTPVPTTPGVTGIVPTTGSEVVPGVAATTTVPASEPSATSEPTVPPTTAVETTQPTSEPEPSTKAPTQAPTTPDAVVTTEAAVEPTVAASSTAP